VVVGLFFMANGKKSFILYCDLISTFEELTDSEAGALIKHVLRYVNDKNPEPPDRITKIAFEPIKQQLKRDLKKYEKYIEKQSVNGKKGGRPSKEEEPKKPKPFFENPTEPKKADSVNVNDNGTVNDSVSVNEEEPPSHEVFKTKLFSVNGNLDLEGLQVQTHETVKENWAAQFNAHLNTEGKNHYHYREWLKHFRSWLVKKIPDLKKQDSITRQHATKKYAN
jgi:hypothetical protein